MKFLLFIGTFIFKHLWQLTRIHEKQVPACHLWSVIEINEDWLDDALPGGTRGGGGLHSSKGGWVMRQERVIASALASLSGTEKGWGSEGNPPHTLNRQEDNLI